MHEISSDRFTKALERVAQQRQWRDTARLRVDHFRHMAGLETDPETKQDLLHKQQCAAWVLDDENSRLQGMCALLLVLSDGPVNDRIKEILRQMNEPAMLANSNSK